MMESRVKLTPAKNVSKSECSWIEATWERKAREFLKGSQPARYLVGFAIVT